MGYTINMYSGVILLILTACTVLTYYNYNLDHSLYNDIHYYQTQCLHTSVDGHTVTQYNIPVAGSGSVSSKIKQYAQQLQNTPSNNGQSRHNELLVNSCGSIDTKKQCSGYGTCFMYKCYCKSGHTGSLCDISDAGAGDMNPHNTVDLIDYIQQQADMDSKLYYEYTSLAFAWYSHLGIQLGHTLELSSGSGCNNIGYQLLTVQPRYMTSYTLIDPLLGKVASKRASCHTISADDYTNILPQRNNQTIIDIQLHKLEQFQSMEQYDTVILNNALVHTTDALTVLTNTYNSLKTNGILILTENTSHINKDVLLHYQQYFELIYINDESVKQRFDIPVEHQSTGQQYYIGRKRSINDITIDQQTKRIEFIPIVHTPHQFKPEFYLIWTAADLQRWRYHVIDSIFYHHPDAIVHIYTHGLQAEQFSSFTKSGYNVQLHYINFHEFFRDTPLESWSQLNFEHYNFRVHVSDAFRLAVVWKYGGIYIDFDFFVLHNLSSLRNMIAHEAYPGMVNGAFLLADRAHPWPQMSMIQFHTVHNITIWASSGPMLQSKMIHTYSLINSEYVERRNKVSVSDQYDTRHEHGLVNVYLPKYFYPHIWEDAPNPKFWRADSIDHAELEWTLSETYGFHVWTAMVGGKLNNDDNVNEKYYMDPDSFMGQLVLRNCVVLCDDFLLRNPRDYTYNKADKVYNKKHDKELPKYHLQPDTAE